MLKPGDVYEAYSVAYARYIAAITGNKGFWPEQWDKLTPVLQRFYADMAAQLNKQFDCLAREEENDEV